ncbi:MAG TPA: hypothetical protein VN753_18575 [Terracidiphilus sp.]|nr:hypothetical protein [Terracidiphilus sp.]
MRRNHSNQFLAAPRYKVAIPAVKFINQASVGRPLMLSDFFSEDTVIQAVYLLDLFRGLRLFKLDTGHWL